MANTANNAKTPIKTITAIMIAVKLIGKNITQPQFLPQQEYCHNR